MSGFQLPDPCFFPEGLLLIILPFPGMMEPWEIHALVKVEGEGKT